MEVFTGKDNQGNTIPDPRGDSNTIRKAGRAMQYPSRETNLYAWNIFKDALRHGRGNPIWDEPENLPPWLGTPPIREPDSPTTVEDILSGRKPPPIGGPDRPPTPHRPDPRILTGGY